MSGVMLMLAVTLLAGLGALALCTMLRDFLSPKLVVPVLLTVTALVLVLITFRAAQGFIGGLRMHAMIMERGEP